MHVLISGRLTWSINPYEGAISDTPRFNFKRNVVDLLQKNRDVDESILMAGQRILGNLHSPLYGVGPGSQVSMVNFIYLHSKGSKNDYFFPATGRL